MAMHLYPRATKSTRDLQDEWHRLHVVAGNRRIWVTEIGFAERPVRSPRPGAPKVAAYRFLRAEGARAIILHRLEDVSVEPSLWQATLGVLSNTAARSPRTGRCAASLPPGAAERLRREKPPFRLGLGSGPSPIPGASPERAYDRRLAMSTKADRDIDPMDAFSERTRRWFDASFEAPTPAQQAGWPTIASGAHTLICAPTGSGKTLSAFLWGIDKPLRSARGAWLPARTSSTSRR